MKEKKPPFDSLSKPSTKFSRTVFLVLITAITFVLFSTLNENKACAQGSTTTVTLDPGSGVYTWSSSFTTTILDPLGGAGTGDGGSIDINQLFVWATDYNNNPIAGYGYWSTSLNGNEVATGNASNADIQTDDMLYLDFDVLLSILSFIALSF